MNLNHIKPVTWDEVFSEWEKGEAELPHWIQYYKERGFNSWKDWRNDLLKPLNPQKLAWNLYKIEEPLKAIPDFYAGPFGSWIKRYYEGERTATFRELATKTDIQADKNINEIINNFPKDSTLVGLIVGSHIVIIEGLHRCCAIALAEKRSINIGTNLLIMCAEYSGEIPTLGQINPPT